MTAEPDPNHPSSPTRPGADQFTTTHTVDPTNGTPSTQSMASDPDEDEVAIRRASLTDRYAAESARLAAHADPDTDDPDTDPRPWTQRMRTRLGTVAARVSDRISAYQESRDRQTATITGVEAYPPVETDSIDTALTQLTTSEVDAIRFELDTGQVTYWYTWEPANPAHPLNKIIAHYANGEFSRLFAPETTVEVTTGVPPLILYPDALDRWSGLLHHHCLRGLRRWNTDDTQLVTSHIEDKDVSQDHAWSTGGSRSFTAESESTLVPTETLWKVISEQTAALMILSFVLTYGVIGVYIFMTSGSTTVSAIPTSILTLIGLGIGVCISCLCLTIWLGRRSADGCGDVLFNGIMTALMILVSPLYLGYRVCARLVGRLTHAFRRIDTRNPYR